MTMKAIRVHEPGGPEALAYEDVPIPEPGPGEVRIKIEAIGVNFRELHHHKGAYQFTTKGPSQFESGVILGSEAAGVVDKLGPEVGDFDVGARVVYGMEEGAYAEYAVVPTWKVVPLPEAIDFRLGAASVLQGITAHYLCFDTYPLQSGEIALVHAAAGGVGHLLIQLAKQAGAHVIGTVSTEEKAALVRELGADSTIIYTQVDFETETKRLTDGLGVHVVYDSVGLDTFEKSLNVLRPRGYLVLFGYSSGQVPPFDPWVLAAKGSLYLTRTSLNHYAQDHDELQGRLTDLFDWMAAGKLQVHVDREFPLADAAEALRYLEDRKSSGKILLIPT